MIKTCMCSLRKVRALESSDRPLLPQPRKVTGLGMEPASLAMQPGPTDQKRQVWHQLSGQGSLVQGRRSSSFHSFCSSVAVGGGGEKWVSGKSVPLQGPNFSDGLQCVLPILREGLGWLQRDSGGGKPQWPPPQPSLYWEERAQTGGARVHTGTPRGGSPNCRICLLRQMGKKRKDLCP